MVRPGEPPTLSRVPFLKELQAPGRMQHLLQSQEIQMSQCRRRVQSQDLKQDKVQTDKTMGAPNPHSSLWQSGLLPDLCTLEENQVGRDPRWPALRGTLWTSQVELGSELTGVFSCASRCLCHCPDSASAGVRRGAGGLFAFGRTWGLCLSEVNLIPTPPFWVPK